MFKKIVDCHLTFDCLHDSLHDRNIWATIKVKEEGQKNRYHAFHTHRISYRDALKMVSCEGTYELELDHVPFSPAPLCNPGGENDFGWVISLLLNAAFYYGMITPEEFVCCVRKHFESYYLKKYRSKRKLCRDFFNRYFRHTTKVSFSYCYEKLFDYYELNIEQKGRAVYVERGGEFAGCYYDNLDRLRPITSPKYLERIIPIAEKLWVCFMEEILSISITNESR